MSVSTTLEPVSNYEGSGGYTPLVLPTSQTDTPLTLVANTTTSSPSSSQTATTVDLQGMVGSQKFTSATTIGLAIGLPVGVFCLGLLVFLCMSKLRKKASLTHCQSINSPSLSHTSSSEQGWLSSILYGRTNKYGNVFAPEKRLPLADSSTIQYRVSKPNPQHILTPKAPLCRDDATSVKVMSFGGDVDTLLYTTPPNIYHVRSQIPSSNSLPMEAPVGLSSSSPYKRPRPADLELARHKWRYESPLSSWFLRNSTYFGDDEEQVNGVGTIVTPTVQLKQLKILSRINRDYANGSQLLEDEKSPILEKTAKDNDDLEAYGSPGVEIARRPSSVIYGTVNSEPTGSNLSLKIKVKRERKERRQSKLGHHLHDVSEKKPLPLTPEKEKSRRNTEELKTGHVYKVVQAYRACLADEIDIDIGEFIMILASHTDGWCLVEKCTEDGTSKSLLQANHTSALDANGKHYLNNDRGIVPGDCLDEV